MEEGFHFNLNGSVASEDFEVVEVGDVEEPIKPVFIKNTTDIEDILSEAINESLTVCSRRLDCETESERAVAPYPADSLPNDHYSHTMERVVPPVDNNAYTQMIGDSCRLVGGSKFYEVIDKDKECDTPSPQTPTEKHDCMKPTDSDEEVSDVDQECTIFSGVSYLGAAVATSPRCEQEIQRTMATLSSQRESETGIAVSISVPVCSQGLVVLYDGETNAVMARYAVSRIVFYTRGTRDSPVGSCFAFTWSHGESREAAVHQCHVFRCHIAEAVEQVSTCFAKAFERVPASMTSSLLTEASLAGSVTSAVLDGAGSAGSGVGTAAAIGTLAVTAAATPPMQLMHVLECSVDIKEIDAKGTLCSVPKERVGFKLRGGINKQVTMTVQQMFSSSDATYDVAAQVPMTYTGGLYIERCFGILLAPCRNAKQSDLRLLEMVSGVSGGSACSLCAWWNSGEPHLAVFNVPGADGATVYVTLAMDIVVRGITDPIRIAIETPVKIFPPTERFWYYSKRPLVQQFFINLKETSVDESGNMRYEVVSLETSGELDRSRNLTLSLSSLLPSPLTGLQPAPPSPDDDVSDGDEPLLSGTGEVSKDCCEGVLENWAQVLRSWGTTRPKALTQLVRHGVPEALRGEVWQRLAQADQHQHLMDTYRVLITKECACEGVIQRDIARTFPAHEQFREAGGLGQDSLLRVARAYAVYDEEVGYCQGLSFLAATLILHMPEEQAFCVLVRLMYGYGLRDFYKDGFEALYMRLHQLQRLMEEQMGDLKQHFENTGVEPHMFASQWFLTLYTARFPLPLVFHIVDVFLLQGMDTLFQVALALLSRSKRDLMQHDFEGILKYFRVTLPKKCRAEEVSRQIVKHACSIKVKRLHKYRLEFENFAKEATEQEKITTEMERLKTTNSQLLAEKVTLEQQLSESRLATEAALKESARNAVVARDYREICARLDRQFHEIQDIVKTCTSCTEKWSPTDNKKAEASLAEEGSDGELQRRVRDLELELAHVKLSHVQAQCTNQELSHKLNATIAELQATANQKQQQPWPPWLSRTLGSIKEAAQNRPSFQTYLPNLSNAAEDTSSAADTTSRPRDHYNAKRHSMIADLHAVTRRNQDLG